MSTLTFSSIGSNSRRTVHKRLPRSATQVRPAPDVSLEPLHEPHAPTGRKRGRYELAALVGLVLAIHAVIGLSIQQNHSEPVSVPPKVPPIEIQISKPVPLPQALPVAHNVPALVPPRKVEVPKSTPAPAKLAPAPSPVVQDAVAINPAPATSSAQTTNSGATESQASSTRSTTSERITQASANADYLNNPPPKYPAIAQSRGWEGQVMLNVHVLANGRADIVNIEQSSGRKTLDDAAIKAVTEWRFVPAKRGQTPIEGWVQVPIDFKLGK